MFLKTLEHSVSHCLTSLLTHLLYFQTSCLHFLPSCLPSRHMPTPPPLPRGASLCLVYSSSCVSFGNSFDGSSCVKQDFFTTQNSYSITIYLENLSFENHFTCIWLYTLALSKNGPPAFLLMSCMMIVRKEATSWVQIETLWAKIHSSVI